MLLALKLLPRLVSLSGSEKSITECSRLSHAPAMSPINYVFCRFVAFKDDAIKLPEVEGRQPSRGSNVYPVTLLLSHSSLSLSLSYSARSHIIRINGHDMDMALVRLRWLRDQHSNSYENLIC